MMNTTREKTLVVIVGATGVGKTELSLQIAEKFGSSILSADSRQIYKGLLIGTASPTPEERERVPHYFIEKLNIDEYYNARTFEDDSIALLNSLFEQSSTQVVCGGSMLYIDAIIKGIDNIPDVDPSIRKHLAERKEQEGLEILQKELYELDPAFYASTDTKNPKRILHGLEVCLTTGRTYSSFRTQNIKKRNFNIVSIGLERPREELYERINKRVLQMIDLGLENEATKFLPFQHLNALNTVGYKEMFGYMKGEYSLDKAIELIQRNSRHYAKKQITWFKKNTQTMWFHPNNVSEIMNLLSV